MLETEYCGDISGTLRLKPLPYGLNITTMVNVGYRLVRSDDEATR
jgi:hypothetical protein